MALTYVGGNSGKWLGATTGDNNVSLTALTGGSDSSAAIGDIVVAVYATKSTTDRTLTIGDGTNPYTLAGSELYANSLVDSNLRVAYKVLTAADANCVFGPTGGADDPGTAIVHVWRDVDPTTQMDVTVVTATGTGSGSANPGAITPTTAGAVVIVAAGKANGGGESVFTQSGTELSNFLSIAHTDLFSTAVAVGSYAWASGAFDPVALVGGGGAGSAWTAVTLALRPATELFRNSNTFYSATITQTGPMALFPSLASNSNTFYAATITTGAVAITPGLFSNSNTFYRATVSIPGSSRLKYWDGAAWQQKTLKYWNGVSFDTKPLKYWDGANWQT